MLKREIPQHLQDYFIELKLKEGIDLTEGQKNWYFHQWIVLGDKTKQEYPSTPQEAFMASTDAYFFANEVQEARKSGRIIPLNYKPQHPVFVSFDIGVFDHTVLWFYQFYEERPWFIDYYEDHNKSYDFYITFALQEKEYQYQTFFLPHDAAKRDDVTLLSYADKVRRLLDPKKIETFVLEKDDPIIGINNAKVQLNYCYIDSIKCDAGINHLVKYKRKWSEQAGWIHEPQRSIHSHCSDSFRYACLSIDKIKLASCRSNELHRKAVSRAQRLI